MNSDRLAPIGGIGELLIEGPILGRGYLNDDERTKQAFIEDTEWLSEESCERPRRPYRTGDLVRYDVDGSIIFLGRKDAQVKIRGEPSEIECHMSTYPGVAVSIAAFPESGLFSSTLVAVLQLRTLTYEIEKGGNDIRVVPETALKAANIEVSKISANLSKRLPSHMIPTKWVFVERIPFSAAAKVDRKRINAWLVGLEAGHLFALSEGSAKVATGSLITKNEHVALEISTTIAELIARGDSRLQSALEGRNFILSSTGIDSIKVVTLAHLIKRVYGVQVGIERLSGGMTTVRDLAEYIFRAQGGSGPDESFSQIYLRRELNMLREELKASSNSANTDLQGPITTAETVFVTGATGFLGTLILRQLCAHPNIKKIVAHVRASTVEHGLQRLVKSAQLALWWSETFYSKLEVWLGDLAEPKLGLTTEQWKRLTGDASFGKPVEAIIHNGAVVHWNASYDTLKRANVMFTLDLIKATAQPASTKFIYVSGGEQWDEDEDDRVVVDRITSSNGYAQTKYISGKMVQEFAQKLT